MVAELDEIGLVLLVARCDQAVDLSEKAEAEESQQGGAENKGQDATGKCVVDLGLRPKPVSFPTYLALELDLLIVAVRDVPFGKARFAPGYPGRSAS